MVSQGHSPSTEFPPYPGNQPQSPHVPGVQLSTAAYKDSPPHSSGQQLQAFSQASNQQPWQQPDSGDPPRGSLLPTRSHALGSAQGFTARGSFQTDAHHGAWPTPDAGLPAQVPDQPQMEDHWRERKADLTQQPFDNGTGPSRLGMTQSLPVATRLRNGAEASYQVEPGFGEWQSWEYQQERMYAARAPVQQSFMQHGGLLDDQNGASGPPGLHDTDTDTRPAVSVPPGLGDSAAPQAQPDHQVGRRQFCVSSASGIEILTFGEERSEIPAYL